MEMNKETLDKMAQMRLQGMYYAFKTSLESLHKESMTIDQFVSWLIISEWDDRRNLFISTQKYTSVSMQKYTIIIKNQRYLSCS